MAVSSRRTSAMAATVVGVAAISSTACIAHPGSWNDVACTPSLHVVGAGFAPDVSPDGSAVAYLAEDAAGFDQVWVRSAGQSARALTSGPRDVHEVAVSGDGRWVVYVAEVDRDDAQIRRTNLSSGVTEDLTEPITAPTDAFDLAVAHDGETVAFAVDSAAIGARDSGVDVAVWTASGIDVVSQPSGAVTWSGSSGSPSLSADGSTVVFATTTELDPSTPTGGHHQVVAVELASRAVSTVSAVGGVAGDGASTEPSISADGRTVVFSTEASNLANGAAPAYGRAVVASRSGAGSSWTTPAALGSRSGAEVVQYGALVSADGSRAVFFEVSSSATPQRTRHVVVWDRAGGALTSVASRSEWTQTPTWRGNGLAITGNGAQVFFDADTAGAAPRPSVVRWTGC